MTKRAFARAGTTLCTALVLGGMAPVGATPAVTATPSLIERSVDNAPARFESSLAGSSRAEAPVADAAELGDIDTVRSLLRAGADVNEAQGDGMTALHWAAQSGSAELAEVLVYAGARLDAGTRIGGYTPLHIAAREGRVAVVEVLLEAGANPATVTTNSGVTPLHLAARSGNAKIVSQLIARGADVNQKEGAWGQTPLVFAAAMNRVEAIEALLKAGADPNAAAHVIDVAEMAEADEAADDRLRKALESFKEQQGGGPGWEPTPSQVQAAIELAREVQARWPDVPKDDDEGEEETTPAETPEGEAAAEVAEGEAGAESEDVAEVEGEAGAEPVEGAPRPEEVVAEGAADEGTAAEDAADAEGEAEPAEGEEGEQPERPLSYAQQVEAWGGLSPIHHAVRQGHVEATLALLEGGADIDQPTGDHTTPLLMASINGQWDLAAILLERGADPKIASTAGATPLYAVLEREWQPRASYAHPTAFQQQETSHLEMMELLLAAGADPNARLTRHLWYMEYTFGVLRGSGIDLQGATPFWRAAYALDLDAMRLLTAWGADADIWTMKPPQRRRRPTPMEEETGQEPTGGEGEAATPENAAADSAQVADAEATAEVSVKVEPLEVEASEGHVPHVEGEEASAEPSEEAPAEPKSEEEEDEEPEDKSGVPPVPTGGPAIHALHAASGVGYGQSFAGNAHRYVPNGWLPAVKFLVEELGADVNARDANGYTALHHAASRGDIEMIRYLVAHGADVTVVSRKGETTADMANGPVQRVQPYPEAIALLEELGAVNNHNCVSCE